MNYESVPPPLPHVADAGALMQRVGAVLGLAAVSALWTTLPAAIRVAAALQAEAPTARAWAAAWAGLAAAALGPMMVSIVVLRGARQGWRSFGEPVLGLRAFGVALWLAALLVTLSMFGTALRAQTHHRALAAITFACGSLALALAYAMASARVVQLLRSAGEKTRRFGLWSLGGFAAAAVAWLAIRFARAIGEDPSSAPAAAVVVDVLSFLGTAIAASFAWDAARRSLSIAGPPLAVFLTALGVTTLRDPPVHQAIGEHAPTFANVGDLVSGQ
ncbi:MAG: hypothetical protein JOZ69_14585 [Myxococcales bacterium]|nr:hypothetical protein [Myxococcales bacterium]